LLSRLRVPAGYLAGAAVLVLARPAGCSLAAGLLLAAAGEAVRIWASGHIDKTRALATGGPYAHTRNPLYFGSVLIALGVAVASASAWAVLAVGAYLCAFYPAVVSSEAAFLRARFPEPYREWSAAVPAFLPRVFPAGPRATRFEWRRVGANREWRTCAALPVAAALLYARGRFLPW
jgi:protein-S-isoprenylcysteine O-methyltransferase Ste14